MGNAYREDGARKRGPWNGRDFYYSAGGGDRRRWPDMAELGFISADLEAPAMDRGLDDPDRCEYVVRVRWEVAWPREEAFWIPGLYANENSVTKLRDEWTLARLEEAFGVS